MKTIDSALGALADPTRRAIIEQLLDGSEHRVSDIVEFHSMSFAGVSKHVRVLESAGLVGRRKSGRTHFLHYRPEGLQDATDWIDQTKALWNRRLGKLESLLESDESKK
ncbi:MAG: metalloregulator ArsR/SmtB family transcription factor [Pseudomonadota bacterium]